MIPNALLVFTIGLAIGLGIYFGWRKNPKFFALYTLGAAVLLELGATALGLNKGLTDTLLKQLLILSCLGLPFFLVAQHASAWKAKTASFERKNVARPPVVAIHSIGFLNVVVPISGLLITLVIMLVAKAKAVGYVPQLVDSARFQVGLSLLLIFSYAFSDMPIGIYMASVVIFYAIGKVGIGLWVIASGYEYRYCNSQTLTSRLTARFSKTIGRSDSSL